MTKAEAQNNNALPHDLILEGRGKLTVTGVRRMLRCDPDSAAMETTKGTLTLAGAQLSVTSLDLDKGEVTHRAGGCAGVYGSADGGRVSAPPVPLMGPALSPGQVGQEAAACAVLGACLGAGRAFFPVRGRGALLPDVLLMGGLLLGTQSYAASLSAGGVPRWYMLAAAIAGIALAEHLLGVPLRAVGRVLRRPLDGLAKYAAAHAQARAARNKAAKERRNEKRLAKKPKKNLPSERRVLYNSNVSK